MKIWMIWVTDSSGAIWMTDAWDDASRMDNDRGWDEVLADRRREHGPENIRVITGRVDYTLVEQAFDTPSAGRIA